jgi:hypothetical protein
LKEVKIRQADIRLRPRVSSRVVFPESTGAGHTDPTPISGMEPDATRGDVMKRKLETCLLALALTPGLALAGSSLQIRDLAAATGLSERQVQMVVGGRTAYAEYRTSYDRVEKRFVKALGEERYRDLMAGREIMLDNGVRVAFNDR